MNSAGELRKDYLLEQWVLIATARKKRPKQFKQESTVATEGIDYFAPGNESKTPPEIGRISAPDGSWKLRWFANMFAALAPEGQPEPRTENRFFTFADSYGYHEVIVETPGKKQLAELSAEDVELLLSVYLKRIKELGKKENIKYVNIFKNHGQRGGTSIVHSHSQVMATSFVPDAVKQEVAARKRFVECPHCKIIEIEKNSLRRCFENNDFIAFAPYASRFNFECWIFPKKHIIGLEQCNLGMLAEILLRALQKINALGASYNFVLHYSPLGDDLHFHIEIMPRIATWAGFELGTNATINTVAPEDAAKYYRGEYDDASC